MVKSKKGLALIILVSFFQSISYGSAVQDSDSVRFRIEGSLSLPYKKAVISLSWEEPWEMREFLKTEIVNGKFILEGAMSQPSLGRLRVVTFDDSLKPIQKFPWECDQLDFFICAGRTIVTGRDSLATAGIRSECKEQKQLLQLNREMAGLSAAGSGTKYYNKIRDFVSKNRNSYLSVNLLNEWAYGIRDSTGAEKVGLVWKSLSRKMRGSPLAIAIHERIEQKKDKLVGTLFRDFELLDPRGELRKLSSFKGDYILLDFWASWCYPCRKKYPGFKEVYTKYKEKGFRIVGVSIDNKKDLWLQAIEKDGLPWDQLYDGDNFKGGVARLYDISAIPKNYLIDRKGKIIAQNLDEDKLEEILQRDLGK